MAFPDQAMIILPFSSRPEKQNRRKGIGPVLISPISTWLDSGDPHERHHVPGSITI